MCHTEPFGGNRETQTDVLVRMTTIPLPPGSPLSSGENVSLVQMLENLCFRCLYDALLFIVRCRRRPVEPWEMICTQPADGGGFASEQGRLGLQPSHIGHVVVAATCRNYMWLWPESKLRWSWPHPESPTRLHQTKEKQCVWHQLWPGPLNRSVYGSRNLEEPLNSPSGALCVCLHSVYLHADIVFARSVLSALFRQC